VRFQSIIPINCEYYETQAGEAQDKQEGEKPSVSIVEIMRAISLSHDISVGTATIPYVRSTGILLRGKCILTFKPSIVRIRHNFINIIFLELSLKLILRLNIGD
jgi:hypothetical protein